MASPSYGATEGLPDVKTASKASSKASSQAASNPEAKADLEKDDSQLLKEYEEDPYEEAPVGFMECSSPYVAEFVGTYLIVFTVGCCAICGDPDWNPTAMAFMLVVAMYSFGPVSGAHLNPAVTLCLGFCFKFPWAKSLGYIVMQLLGGLAAAFSYWTIFGKTVVLGAKVNDKVTDKITTYMGTKYHTWDYALGEAIFTFLLCFVFINCVASRRNNKKGDQNHFFGLAVGFVYIAGGYPMMGITGSFFNPATSVALAFTTKISGNCPECWPVYWCTVYCLGQVAGAWFASVVFAIVRPEDFTSQFDGKIEDYEVPVRSKLTAELVGTFMVATTVGLNVVMESPAVPWSSAACYMCLIYALGDVSGGHFNPAVTLSAMLTRRDVISMPMGQAYISNQVFASLGAAFVFAHYDIIDGQKGAALGPHTKGDGWVELGTAEVLFTTLLCLTYLTAVTTTMPPSTTKTNFYFGLSVGSCITIGGFAIGALSGGMLNPAVAFGRSFAQVITIASIENKDNNWWSMLRCLWYSLYEFTGSILAAGLFSLTHHREYLKDATGMPHICN